MNRTRLSLIPALLLPLLMACGGDGSRDTAPADEAPPPGSVTESFAEGPPRAVSTTTRDQAEEGGVARFVYFFVPSSGFAYRDGEGRLTGVTVELLRDFARHVSRTQGLDVEVQWVEEPLWADFYGYVRDSQGAAFGIGNVTITEARDEELDFSPPYLRNIAVLVTHESVPELGSMNDIGSAFTGLTALRYPGTLHEARLLEIRDTLFPEMTFRPVASNDELVGSLTADEGVFGYIDIYNYWRAREAGRPLRRHPVGDDAAETFGVILPNRSDWTPVIRSFFEADGGYTNSARYLELLRSHLGEELAGLLTGESS